jgi:hypothetical protein
MVHLAGLYHYYNDNDDDDVYQIKTTCGLVYGRLRKGGRV